MNNSSLKIAIAQLNFIVGDLEGNFKKITDNYHKACEQKADLILFSELSLTGYPPEDLLLKGYFIKETEEYLKKLCVLTKAENKQQKPAMLVGAPASFTTKEGKKLLYNSAFLMKDGQIEDIINKSILPNYGVFDEKRYFTPAIHLSDVKLNNFCLGILICEDIWDQKNAFLLACKEVDAILAINASPFTKHKIQERLNISKNFIKDIKQPLIYVNQIGTQDSIVFEGSSFALKGNGDPVLFMKSFAEDFALTELVKNNKQVTINNLDDNHKPYHNLSSEAQIYQAVVLSIRDYIHKNGFDTVMLGLSGGIDSALVAAMAIDALGSDKVKTFALPSRYNSKQSMDDALKLSKNLDVKLEVIPIETAFNSICDTLSQQFTNTKPDITEENIQSRIRGLLLMAISNKFGHLLLSTGNKSEMAVGYATIYGDMCGAYNPLKDIYKTEVFNLAKWRNQNIPEISVFKKSDIIPENIITKEPSAELRENQKDSDSLPDYQTLDQILTALIESQKSVTEIINMGFNEKTVKKIANLFYKSEYKRRQAVIGAKISDMSFDKDRRYPITNRFTR